MRVIRRTAVDDVREDLDASELDGQDKGRRLCVCAAGAEKNVTVRGDNKAHDKDIEDVEEGDAPEYLAGSFRESLARVRGFSGCEAYHFGTAKGEG